MELQHGDLSGTTATLLAGIDRALDPNGDGDLADHADVILAPVAEPFAAFGASPETIAAEGAERAGAVLVAAAGNDGSTGGRFGTVASPGASPGWLAVGASDGRVTLPRVGVTLTTDGVDNELGDMPLAGALTPASGSQMPLVLPAGPTDSDPAARTGRHRRGDRRGRLPRRRHEHRQGQGRAAAARRRDDHASARPRPARPAPRRSCSTATAACPRARSA